MLVAVFGGGMTTSSPEEVAMIGRQRLIRLLTLTTLFPNSRHPRHGIFVADRLRRLCATGRVEATVVSALPWFPGAYRDLVRIPPVEAICGFDVCHPRYVNVPALGMRMQPDSLARALLQELRRSGVDAGRFDVVDAHYFFPDGVAAARVARELALPLVITARGSDINLIGGIALARQRMLEAAREARALIAVSEALANAMAALGMPRERIHVLRNGVDMELFAPAPRLEARRRIGLDEGGAWVLGVGNLVPEKGFDLLIRAVALLANARLLLIGQGPLRQQLQSLADRAAPGRVVFRDNMPRTELRYAYAACDVLGLPSLREGWPNVLLEAISCGVPVVASAVGGVPEIVRSDPPGRLVIDRSPEVWQLALAKMLDAPPPSDEIRRHALDFGWDEVVARQCNVYEAVASDRVPDARRRCA